MDIHVENPAKPVDRLGITGEKRFSQKEKEECLWNGRRNEIRIGSITSESGNWAPEGLRLYRTANVLARIKWFLRAFGAASAWKVGIPND